MSTALKRSGRILVTVVLLVALFGLLLGYLIVVYDLPERIYTPAQQEYLHYNSSRSVSQYAPVWNLVEADGQLVSTVLPVQMSRIYATLAARYEEHSGVSLTVYDLDFRGEYDLVHAGPGATTVELFFPFPSNLETLHGVRFLLDDVEPAGVHYSKQGIHWRTTLPAGSEHRISISYQANGVGTFSYGLHHDQRSDVDVTVTVLGLTGSEVPRSALRPSANESSEDGETFTWTYDGLIADRDIQLDLPQRLSFAQRVAQLQDDFRALALAAPWLVGLFLAALAGVLNLGGVRLRPVGYLLAGCAMALFYPLLTFLSGLVDLSLSAPLALLVVSGLLLLFVGRVAGRQQTWRTVLLLGTFLGFFSIGMITPWRGLMLSVGGVLLVATFMLLYARWRAQNPIPSPALTYPPSYVDGLETSAVEPETSAVPEAAGDPGPPGQAELVAPQPSEEVTPEPLGRYCPYCARALGDEDNFCPGCGQETNPFQRCAGCGREQFVPPELRPAYCLHCGEPLLEGEY